MRMLLLITLFCISSLHAAVFTSETMSDLSKHVDTIDADTLVVLDVDDTLIYPRDVALRSSIRPVFQKILQTSVANLQTELPYLNTQLMLQMAFDPVEQQSAAIVKELQAKKVPVIALTASYGGTIWGEVSNADIRIMQVNSVGHDFSSAFPDVGHFEFIGAQGAAFKDGVLFSAQYPKGEILMGFLKMINWMPKKIIFVDDRIDFIQSVETACRLHNIESICLHYTAVEKIPMEIDWEHVVLQATHFAKHAVWLSDKEIHSHLHLSSEPE